MRLGSAPGRYHDVILRSALIAVVEEINAGIDL